MKAVLGGGGKRFGNEQVWNDIIREIDVNGDDEIEYEEFKAMMEKLLGGEK